MAENVFAVSFGTGFTTTLINNSNVLSCGRPIPGVELKIVDDEIWVRSPTSIQKYFNGPDIRDVEGYYPTGDLGQVISGELFVSGRKQDLLIQGGRKFILSDIDLWLNGMFPDVRGRAVTLALHDDRVGTEVPFVLIESLDFFERHDNQIIALALKEATGLDRVDVGFVPPRFLTKTSSGKFNRKKAAADWNSVQAAIAQQGGSQRNPIDELRASFANVDWTKPIGVALDSLSRTILNIIVESANVSFDDSFTLVRIQAVLGQQSKSDLSNPVIQKSGIRIVSLANRTTLSRFSERHLEKLSQAFGCDVSFEHLCLPPSAVVLSDLVFYDYFKPRLDPSAFASVSYAMEQLKAASILIVDDMAEMTWRYESTYPVLSHNLERDPRADLISFRWQQYTRHHDKLPIGLVSGMDMPLSATSDVLDRLSSYLNIPVFRIAVAQGFAAFTGGWELRSYGSHLKGVDADVLVDRIVSWAATVGRPPERKPHRSSSRFLVSDLAHFCSHIVNKTLVDRVLDHFDRFCIAGEKSSLPYVRAKLDELQKAYVQVPSHAPEVLTKLTEPFDCLLLCGPIGDFPTDIPVVALQHAGAAWRTRNLGSFGTSLPGFGDMPASSTDWYYTFDLSRQKDREIWSKARMQLRSEDIIEAAT